MIITRTPFRKILGGGGTDLPPFCQKHCGFVFAMTINKCAPEVIASEFETVLTMMRKRSSKGRAISW